MSLKFSQDHEWIDIETGLVGITDYAQQQLGDVVFVELPEVGARLKQHGEAAVVESVKAASEVFAPATGEVIETNEALEANPALVNESPMEDGWFFKIDITSHDELENLMDEGDYESYIADL